MFVPYQTTPGEDIKGVSPRGVKIVHFGRICGRISENLFSLLTTGNIIFHVGSKYAKFLGLGFLPVALEGQWPEDINFLFKINLFGLRFCVFRVFCSSSTVLGDSESGVFRVWAECRV